MTCKLSKVLTLVNLKFLVLIFVNMKFLLTLISLQLYLN